MEDAGWRVEEEAEFEDQWVTVGMDWVDQRWKGGEEAEARGGRASDLITLRAPVPSSNSNLFSYTCVASDSRVNCLWQGWLLSLCIIWTLYRHVTYRIRCPSFNFCTWKSDISEASELIEARCVITGEKRKKQQGPRDGFWAVTLKIFSNGLHSQSANMIQLTCLKFTLILSFSPGSDDLDPDLVRLGSLGFTGCLSAVQFNSVSPLKAALLHPHTSPVTITGPLTRSACGSSVSANPHAAEDTHHLTGRSGWDLLMAVILKC